MGFDNAKRNTYRIFETDFRGGYIERRPYAIHPNLLAEQKWILRCAQNDRKIVFGLR